MTLYYATTTNANQKTLDAALNSGVTASATFNNTTGIQNKKGVFVVDRVDTNGVLTPNKREYIGFTGTSGSTVVTLTRNIDGGGSDQDHAVGAIVEFGPDAVWADGVMDALDNLVDSTGAVDTTKVVTLTGTQTLTNKTLTSPALTTPTLTSPTINVTSDAQGDIYFRNSSGSLARLAPGTSGHFLKTQGAAADPVWAAPTSGLVSTARARASLGTAQDNLTSNTPTKVTLQTEQYDPGSNFDSATNYRFVAPVTGFYQISASITYNAIPTTDKSYGGHIYKNGAAISSRFVDGSHTGDYLSVSFSDVVSLTATDYIELYAHHVTGANTPDLLADPAYTYLAISFIGT